MLAVEEDTPTSTSRTKAITERFVRPNHARQSTCFFKSCSSIIRAKLHSSAALTGSEVATLRNSLTHLVLIPPGDRKDNYGNF